MKFDTKKGLDLVSGALNKATDIGKSMADNVQSGAKELAGNVQSTASGLAEKAKDDAYLRRLKKYNPLFPDKYNDPSFDCPQLITIVDDAIRRDIDVCEGAIGWLETVGNNEILFLYDTAVEFSGLKFIPTHACDETYYVDNFDHQRYIRVDQLFSKAHEEKLAELQHIAASLGAKSCSIKIIESSEESSTTKKSFIINAKAPVKCVTASSGSKSESSSSSSINTSREGAIVTTFKGSDEPKEPTLKWFKYDETILKFIESRLSGSNPVQTHQLRLKGSSSATMSQKVASSIDGSISKFGSKKSSSMESQANKELSSELEYIVEF